MPIFQAFILIYLHHKRIKNEQEHNKTNRITCAPSEFSEQPGHLPSLISLRVAKYPNLSQADSDAFKTLIRLLHRAHKSFVGFVMLQLINFLLRLLPLFHGLYLWHNMLTGPQF